MSTTHVTYDPAWQEKYQSMVATPTEALARLKPGQRIFIGTGCAAPQELVNALAARAAELPDTEIVHLLTFGDAPYARRELASQFRVNSFFVADNVRDIILEGLGDYTPVFLSEIPRLFNSGQMPLDTALVQVSPPDASGMCTLGVSVDIVKSAIENSALVIAEINPHMPRTHGNSQVHVFDLDVLVPVNTPVIEVPLEPSSEESHQVAEHLAALIDDGCTIEVGIGRIPQALLAHLKDKRDLGIHTEMVTDAYVDLIESGAVTGSRKTLDRGKVVASFAVGTRKLYDFIDNNPMFSFQPTEYVNDLGVISSQHRMVAVNTALEVDLTGQICADSLGGQMFSGVGGQVDFNRGASKSHGGRAIIALPSTARDTQVSRIVTNLAPGAGVVTTRAAVHYVVTEFGVAYLHGKSIQQRALALISIAHPDFRAQLLREAIAAKYLSASMSDMEGKILVGPKELRTTFLLADGSQIALRPIHPTDESRMRDLFYDLSQQTMYYRFMSFRKVIPRREIQEFVYIDHRHDVTIVATVPSASGEDILAVGSYYLDPKTNVAEVAFVVRDEWQSRGIGTQLLRHLIQIARRNGIRGFSAEVLNENKAMQAVFNSSNCKLKTRFSGNVTSYELAFE
ncbi:MAG: GNAT family N-acetyltransferase [Limisphaerales bacterium]